MLRQRFSLIFIAPRRHATPLLLAFRCLSPFRHISLFFMMPCHAIIAITPPAPLRLAAATLFADY